MPENMAATNYPIESRQVSTFYFIGVSTGGSSIMKIFPLWVYALGRPEVVIQGIDHPLRDELEAYRRTVAQIKNDPRSLGALVTSHKISLCEAAIDLFDELDTYAQITGEISCIAKRNGKLLGFAKDPITSGNSLDAILGQNYFGRTGGHVFCMGAGGSGVAIALHLINKEKPSDRPERMIVVNRSRERLDKLQAIAVRMDTNIEFEFIQSEDAAQNDEIMESLPNGSVVINATGMGKDIPGSPISDDGLFPRDGVAWELNYRGDLDFWHQAMTQKESQNLIVEDGWLYFLYGWSEHISEVLNVELNGETFRRLAELAEDLRPRLVFSQRHPLRRSVER